MQYNQEALCLSYSFIKLKVLRKIFMEIVTSEIMQFIENHSQEMGVSKDALMHNAGLSIATFIKTRYMETRMGQNVVVLWFEQVPPKNWW